MVIKYHQKLCKFLPFKKKFGYSVARPRNGYLKCNSTESCLGRKGVKVPITKKWLKQLYRLGPQTCLVEVMATRKATLGVRIERSIPNTFKGWSLSPYSQVGIPWSHWEIYRRNKYERHPVRRPSIRTLLKVQGVIL